VRPACLLLGAAILGAGCGGHATPAQRPSPARQARHDSAPLIASTGIGTISGDCRSGTHVKLTFRADYLSPTESVSATAGRRRMRANLDDLGAASITVPLVPQRPRPMGFDSLSPIVTWTVFQSHEPSETRVRARLQVTTLGPECLPALTQVHLVSHSHAG
jgi:hypothetical protein